MSRTLAWSYLFLAIITEVAGITAMKLSAGFTNLQASLFIFIFYTISFVFLAFSLKKLDVGVAYAIWSGLGTLLIFLIGISFFGDTVTPLKMVSVFLIIMGVLGLRQA